LRWVLMTDSLGRGRGIRHGLSILPQRRRAL
jgi:hypothetical protein